MTLELLTFLHNPFCIMRKLVIVPDKLADLLLKFLNAQTCSIRVSLFKFQSRHRAAQRVAVHVEGAWALISSVNTEILH